MNIIWVARGRAWGYRFLLDGGFSDPLPEYDAAFSSAGSEREACIRTDGKVALRFPDPLGRTDRAGRIISHEFVVFGALADRVHSLDEGIQAVWHRPGIADEFARIWDQPLRDRSARGSEDGPAVASTESWPAAEHGG